MQVSDFDFDLPKELIAQTPLENRASSRLLVMDRNTGHLSHEHFCDFVKHLTPMDCLVLNNTKVMPARLLGKKQQTGGKVELLLLRMCANNTWETLASPGRKVRPGDTLIFGEGQLKATVLDILPNGNRVVNFAYEGVFETVLAQLGEMPLPPYITETLQDKNRYQTVYAKAEGSAAAPTAGLHFTKELLAEIEAKGIKIAFVTLHVGIGTFRPVKVETLENHEMHAEYCEIEADQAAIINQTKQNGGRIIAVGTTSCRTLESRTNEHGILQAGSGFTNIFIYPGYSFKIIDGLVTNFHLPKSTLVMLVSAFCGKENTLFAYQSAIEQQYRFFSFGDAMFIC